MGCVSSVPDENRSKNIEVPSDNDTDNDTDEEYPSVPKPSQSPPQLFDTKSLPDKYYLIQILKATDIPKTETLSQSNPYVMLKIFDCDSNKQKGNDIISLYGINSYNPIWNCYNTFKASEFHDKLVFEIYTKTTKKCIGNGEIKIKDVFINCNMNNENSYSEDEDYVQEITINNTINNTIINTIKLHFKLFAMQCSPNTSQKKTIFFIENINSIDKSIQFNKLYLLLNSCIFCIKSYISPI
eukprot:479925_1